MTEDELAKLVVLARYMQMLSNDLCRNSKAARSTPPLVPAELQGQKTVVFR